MWLLWEESGVLACGVAAFASQACVEGVGVCVVYLCSYVRQSSVIDIHADLLTHFVHPN